MPGAPGVPGAPVSSEKRPMRLSSWLTYQTDPSAASDSALGWPLPRGSAHSVTVSVVGT